MAFDYLKALEKRKQSTPQAAYLWCVELPDLTQHPENPQSASHNAAKKATENSMSFDPNVDTSLLNTLVTNIQTPFFQMDTDKVVDGSTFWYKAKHNDISNITLTLEEQADGTAMRFLNNWRTLIIGENGYNPPHFYKRDIKVHRLNPGKEIFQTFVYKDYFISEVSSASLDYATNSPLEYSATFTGDSLISPVTVQGAELRRLMDDITNELENIDIPYSRFKRFGVTTGAAANLLTELARRVL